jgi:hypothetical protein
VSEYLEEIGERNRNAMLGNESSNKLEHYPSLLLGALQEAIASGVSRSKGWAML